MISIDRYSSTLDNHTQKVNFYGGRVKILKYPIKHLVLPDEDNVSSYYLGPYHNHRSIFSMTD